MFDDNPAHRERAIGLAALAAIGLGGAIAVDLLVTGGFDFRPRQAAYDREQPGAHVRTIDAAEYVAARPSFGVPFTRPPDTSQSEERLAGGDDGSAPPDIVQGDNSSGDQLYRDIAALYADSEDGYREAPRYEDAPAIDADEPYAQEDYEEPFDGEEYAYEDEYADEGAYEDDYVSDDEYEQASAYETGSPW